MSIHIAAQKGQVASTVLMPGDPLRAEFIAKEYLTDAVRYTDIRNMYGFTGKYKGIPVSVQGSGMGMPSMGIYSWELLTEYDVKNIIRIGSCGVFRDDISLGDVLIADRAVTDSNYGHAFDIPIEAEHRADSRLLELAAGTAEELKVPHFTGTIVSCDVFYEIKENWWQEWRDKGVMGVEMEAAALYMNTAALCRMKQDEDAARSLALISASDSFISDEHLSADERVESFRYMMETALEMAVKL